MTDIPGNLLWYGEYTSWGRLKKDEQVYKNAHQPFRLQKNPCPHWYVATAKMDGNLSQKEIMGMVHFLGSTTKIM